MKWYKQTYVNRRDWVLENLEFLKLTPSEAMVVILIDYLNVNSMDITIELLAKKTSLTIDEINKLLSVLVAKRYLVIEVKNKKIKFNLDNLFEIDIAQSEQALDNSLFDVFEHEFKRPLTHQEMEHVSKWARYKDKKIILNALKEASMYKKVSISYIDKVIKTLEDKQAKELLAND